MFGKSVVQPWLANYLTCKMQTVLFTDKPKPVVRPTNRQSYGYSD